jgi:hypothetical protein
MDARLSVLPFFGASFTGVVMGIEFCDLHPDRSTIRQTNKNIQPRFRTIGESVQLL